MLSTVNSFMKEATLQTLHVNSTLKRHENGRFDVVSTWNPRGVFVGRYDLETSPLTSSTSEWTGLYDNGIRHERVKLLYSIATLFFSKFFKSQFF